MIVFHLFQNNSHEYCIEVEEKEKCTIFTLKYSKNNVWVEQNKVLFKVIDDGNGFQLSQHTEEQLSLKMNYSVANEVSLLMRFAMLYSDGSLDVERNGYQISEPIKFML